MSQARQDVIDSWNQTADSDWYRAYRTDEAMEKIIRKPESAFHPAVFAMLEERLGGFAGQRVLIPSSGDNHAAFAFHLLGAEVTSTDISLRQMEHAREIAKKRGWNISFLVEDTMQLAAIQDSSYDLIYTSNGVFVWIHDLRAMFTNIHRVLKPGGAYAFYDIHPFTRPFTDGDPSNEMTMKVAKPYGQIDLGTNSHWRVQDLLNGIIHSGLAIQQIEELFPVFGTYWFESTSGRKGLSEEQLKALYDWKQNPLAAIPAWLSVYAKKPDN